MTADKPKPPTEAELAAIRARAAKVKPKRWYATLVADDYMLLAAPQYASRNMLNREDCADAEHNARLAAHAPADVPALLAAIEERDHLIWVMSQDQEAYRRGVEDGRRQERKETTLWLQAQPGRADGVTYRDPGTVRAVVARYQERDFFDFDPPAALPPDRVREENDRLRAALRRIAMLAADDDSPAGIGMTLAGAQRTAREALGEGA